MTGESTTLPALQNTQSEWSNFLNFLKRPALPVDQAGGLRTGAAAVSRILVLDLLLMGVLLIIATAVMAAGIEMPQTALAGIEITPGIVLAVIVIAPVSEEILFRSWLSGRPRYLIAFPIVILAGLIAAMLGVNNTGEAAQISVGLTVIGAALLTAIMAGILWKRPPMAWFQRVFPVMFWLSTIAFALIHIFNFDESQMAAALPLVLPQFILGALLGYLRVNYGLWTAIALHMIHNGLIITLVMAASAAGAT